MLVPWSPLLLPACCVQRHYDNFGGVFWDKMTQPLLSRQSEPKQDIVKNCNVQNKGENVIKLKCVKCEMLFNEKDLAVHLKVHAISKTMGKSSVESVKNSKTVVKLQTMNFPIKRKGHGSNNSTSKRIKLQDGETELSVDNTVDKVLCKSCKPPRYFKNVEDLQYHLLVSHDVSKSSSYFKNPLVSPAKNVTISKPNPETPKKIRVKSPSSISEIKDMENLETEEASSTTSTSVSVSADKSSSDNIDSQSPLGGKFRELLKVRRMKMKKNVANCRTPKLQPPCLSEKSDLAQSDSDKLIEDVSKKDDNEVNPRRKVRGSLDLNKSNNDSVTEVENTKSKESLESMKLKEVERKSSKVITEEKTFAVPAPVRKSVRVKPPKLPEVKQPPTENPRRRVSERRFEGAKPYKCNHCKLSYSSLENKKVHEQTHIEKNLLCLYCDMRFYVPLCLKKHSRIHKS